MKRAYRHLIYAAATLAAVFLAAVLMGLFSDQREEPLATVLSNAFFVVGVLTAGTGLLTWAGSKGAYDIFGYAGKVILLKFRPKEKLPSYYDYIQQKNESRKVWLKELTVCGGICIAAAALLLLF